MRLLRLRQGRAFSLPGGPSATELTLTANSGASNTSNSEQIPINNEHHINLRARQESIPNIDVSTCGYSNGDGSLPRTAEPGYDCRVDTKYAIWGFCPTTVISASDCGLAGNCQDSYACKSGCGLSGDSSVTTFTCSNSDAQYCSTALLINGPDQTYTYLACATAAVTDVYLDASTTASTQSSTSTKVASSETRPSITSASSTSSTSSTISSSPISVTSSTPSSTSTPLSPISSAPASSSSTSKVTSGAPNNTGAIVGGVLGGLALISFLVVAFLFYRKLKARHGNGNSTYDSAERTIQFRAEDIKKKPAEGVIRAELPSDDITAELSGGRHGEAIELPDHVERSRYKLPNH